jgi:hypothetical protein
LAPDTYDIKVRVPDRGVARYQNHKIAAGEKKRFDIHLEPGITFRANIVDSETGEPVEGITLWNWQQKGIEGTSNEQGVLEIPAMFPGKFEFNVTAAGTDRMRSDVAGNYARWWSDEATKEHQRLPGLDGHGFQRNFDHLEFEIVADSQPITIEVEKCVTITGRVLDPDGNPVAGATVAPAKTGSGNSLTGDTRYSRETKQDGTFEMKLPASGEFEYNLIAHDGKYGQWRNWANGTGEPFTTKPGDRLQGLELRLTRPSTVRGRVISVGGKPLAGKEVRAADFDKRDNRYYHPTTKTDNQGRFELKFVGPGKHYIQCEPFWLDASQAPPGTTTVVEVQEGGTIEGVEIGNLAGEEQTFKAQPADKHQAAGSQNLGASKAVDDDDEHGSQMLRDIRAASAPILAAMAKDHGYGLEPGQNLRRVAPPFPSIRMEYYRTGHPSQSEAIKEGPSAMVFRSRDGTLRNWGMTFGDSADPGYNLTGVLDALLDIKSQQIDGARELLETRLAGDWVIREGADQEAVVKQLQQILQNEFSLPVKLEFREVEREVYVARGEYELTPLPGQEGKGTLILTDETITTDEIQIFGTELVPNSGAGGGTGEFEEFLGWLGRWIGTPIVSEVDSKPTNQVSWHLHERSPSNEQSRGEDHDPILVLGNITLQTGLTFNLEKRPVRILFIERTQ